MAEKEKKTYSFQISAELLEQLRKVAQEECRSVSGMLRVLIRKKVEEFEREQKQ